jgi:biotin transport system substrate-specific component
VGAGLSFLAGSAVVFAFGLPWLAVSLGLNLEQTLQAGLYPFIVGGIIKAIIAAAVMSSAWFLIDRTSAVSDTKNAAE